jgi:hypothetical protein
MATVRIKALTNSGAIDLEHKDLPLYRADHVNKSLSQPSLDRKCYALTIGLRRLVHEMGEAMAQGWQVR